MIASGDVIGMRVCAMKSFWISKWCLVLLRISSLELSSKSKGTLVQDQQAQQDILRFLFQLPHVATD